MLLLIISIAMLALAPVIYFGAVRFPRLWRVFDRLITILVACLVVLHLLPESIRNIGMIAVPLAFLGLFMPSILERLWVNGAAQVHVTSVALALLGLLVHGMLDGAALALPDPVGQTASWDQGLLQLAVVAHRLPAALFLWSLFYPKGGSKLAGGILSLLGLGSLLGFAAAETIVSHLQQDGQVVFMLQALVAGSLLHIAFDRHDHSDHHPQAPGERPLPHGHHDHHHGAHHHH